jgi:hypothetical protein
MQPHFFFFCGIEAWTQGLHLEPLHQPFLSDGVFLRLSLDELFALADFEPW